MNDRKKLEKIKIIIGKALDNFHQAKLVNVKNKKGKVIGFAVAETKAGENKRIRENYYIYTEALEEICEIVGCIQKEPVIEED
jgi:hypothetical protein